MNHAIKAQDAALPSNEADRWTTPLMTAISNGDDAAALALIDEGGLGVHAENGWAAIHFAAIHRRLSILAMICRRGDPLMRNDKGQTALMLAVGSGDAPVAATLLAFGGANEVDHQGSTALIWAARSGDRHCVELLLPHSDLDIRNGSGLTALAMAKLFDCSEAHRAIESYQRVQKESREICESLLATETEQRRAQRAGL